MSLKVTFPTSGVTTWIFLPPLVALLLAYFGAMAGVTGAFLLLPFQMSVLGYTAPGVSATNFLYNLFAIPGTIWRYAREGRLNWPLALSISLGSLPGIGLGYLIRVRYLADPQRFKPFAGLVLLYLAFRLGKDLKRGGKKAPPLKARVRPLSFSWRRATFEFAGRVYSFPPWQVFLVSLVVGVAGGAYGIGGGAILAPYCVSVLKLPVHTVAGASLFGTLVCSVAGVAFYSLGFAAKGLSTRPDFLLGTAFGLGGLVGGYLGARTQKFIPEKPIKWGLFLVVLLVSLRYLASILQ
ncbi:MAG: sulfite exporter TauE/SafE family protein [Thermodesulfobacteria bacterium]|nr:sulfite exporter TauE/SafE family protein [Thermodesulfobacteriota bacterium]